MFNLESDNEPKREISIKFNEDEDKDEMKKTYNFTMPQAGLVAATWNPPTGYLQNNMTCCLNFLNIICMCSASANERMPSRQTVTRCLRWEPHSSALSRATAKIQDR